LARRWTIAVGSVLVLALPWYLRNFLRTGNPLYPVDVHLPGLVLKGLFTTERDQQLQSAGGVWHMLSDTYHSLPTAMIGLLLAGWMAACFVNLRAIVRDALPRACAIGSAVTMILFFKLSPHHEVRYLFPLIVLLFASVGIALAALGNFVRPFGSRIALVFAIGVAAVSVATSFSAELKSSIASLAGEGLLISAIGLGLILFQTRVLRLAAGRLALLGGCALLLFAVAVYVEWRAYVNDYREARQLAWSLPNGYPHQAEIWKWVDDNVPADGTVAYANTFFVYPYYGFDLCRHLEYAPVRKGLHDFSNFPRLGERVPGDLIVRRMTEVMNTDPDRDTWLENLRAMKAEYLVVMKSDPENPDLSANPPELRFARSEPGIFVPVEENEAGVIFRVNGNLKSDAIP
jgi:FtsH-binding integral membrane protein